MCAADRAASEVLKRQRAQFFGWVLCVLWVLRKCCELTDVLGSRSGFRAVHPPPSHLVKSLDELLALDAANDALGTARKAASASAMPTFVTMVIPPFIVGQDCPVAFAHVVSIYIYIQDRVCTDLMIRSSFLSIFTDVHFDERGFMKLKRPSSLRLLVLLYRQVSLSTARDRFIRSAHAVRTGPPKFQPLPSTSRPANAPTGLGRCSGAAGHEFNKSIVSNRYGPLPPSSQPRAAPR
jgi:hypothetical protein